MLFDPLPAEAPQEENRKISGNCVCWRILRNSVDLLNGFPSALENDIEQGECILRTLELAPSPNAFLLRYVVEPEISSIPDQFYDAVRCVSGRLPAEFMGNQRMPPFDLQWTHMDFSLYGS